MGLVVKYANLLRKPYAMNTELISISDLTPDPANARKHGERNLKAIIDSLRAFGQQKPIVVDRRGVVIAGNGTLEAAKRLGWEEIAIVRTELEPTQATAFGIADNRTAELAEWDEEVLVSLLDSLDDETRGLLNFDDEELKSFDVDPVDMPKLDEGDRGDLRQLILTFHVNQIDTIEHAISKAIELGLAVDAENTNQRGNALAAIAAAFLD